MHEEAQKIERKIAKLEKALKRTKDPVARQQIKKVIRELEAEFDEYLHL